MRHAMDFNPFEDAFVGVRIEDGAAVATVLCSSVRERQASVLQKTLEDVARSNQGRVLLDLCGVSILCSSCVTGLLALQELCHSLGGKFVIYGLAIDLADSLKQAGVLKKINHASGEPEARRLLSGQRARGGLFGLLRRQVA